MNKAHYFAFFLLVVTLSSFFFYIAGSPKEKIRIAFNQKQKELDSAITDLLKRSSIINSADTTALGEFRAAYLRCRLKFKEIEFLAEYFTPHLKINKPFLPEVNESDQEVEKPQGFAVIENIIYSNNSELLKELKHEAYVLQVNEHTLYIVNNRLLSGSDSQLFEAMREEITRITTLGITGYDTPESKTCIAESAVALRGVWGAVKEYYQGLKNEIKDKLDEKFKAGIDYLYSNSDFISFNRLEFITEYANPLSELLLKAQRSLNIPVDESPYNLVNYNASNIFDKTAFSRYYLQGIKEGENAKVMAKLGELLFFDPVLSGNGKRTCASCHNPDKVFTDGLERSVAFNFEGVVKRNAPSLANTSIQPLFFHDGRAKSLEEQAEMVIENTTELGGNLKEIARLLNTSKEYTNLFQKAFGKADTAVTIERIKRSVACFERSLISFNSSFDKYIAGDKAALNAYQIKGFNLFMGKGQCATCHFIPLFNGLLPPGYRKMEVEVLGITTDNNFKFPALDEDKGRYAVTNMYVRERAFKTPSVRNAEHTAPYMHNGAFKNMEEVMDFYNRGGGQGLGLEVPNQTLSAKPLNLTSEEVNDIIVFIKSLTDDSFYTKEPAKLPEIKGIERKVGGEY